MDEFESYYPPKPVIDDRSGKRHISITILSILIFVFTFSWIINDYLFILLIIGVLLLHEIGHFLCMKWFKYQRLNLLFIPFIGAMVSGKKKRYSQKEVAIVVLAGPLPGIIIGVALLLFGNGATYPSLLQLGVLFIFLNVLNLIPVIPLDGGKLMQTLFITNPIRYELVMILVNLIASLGLAVLGLVINSWLLIILGGLLGFRIKQKHKMYLIHKGMQQKALPFAKNYADLSNKTYATIKQIVLEYTPSLNKFKEFDGSEEYDQLIASQVDNALYPPVTDDANWGFKFFIAFLWTGAILLSIYALLSVPLKTMIDAFQIG